MGRDKSLWLLATHLFPAPGDRRYPNKAAFGPLPQSLRGISPGIWPLAPASRPGLTPSVSRLPYSRPTSCRTFFKDIERDLRGLAHYVRWVFDVTGESAVVAVVQVVDHNGAILPVRVPYPLDALFEGPHLIDVGLSLGVVEDL